MKSAVYLANFGTYADPHVVLRVARATVDSGWDALFLWDHLAFLWDGPSADPWTTLAAVAVSVDGLTLGTAVTPLPRRRPQVVAQQVETVQRLNGGNVVLGAGLGGNRKEFEAFGEDFDEHRRARLLDERLDVVRELWGGPIWIGGNSARAVERAARWDGWIPNTTYRTTMSPQDLARRLARVSPRDGFAVVATGSSDGPADPLPRAYHEAGATWWFENFYDRRGDLDTTLARIVAGPPRASD